MVTAWLDLFHGMIVLCFGIAVVSSILSISVGGET